MFFAFRRFNKIRKSDITLSKSQIFVLEISFLTCPNAVYLKMLKKVDLERLGCSDLPSLT